MNEYIDTYIDFMENTLKKSANTVKSYKRDITHFLGYLEETGIDNAANVTETVILSYIYELKDMGRAASTISRTLAAMRSFYTYLYRIGCTSYNPAVALVTPKIERKSPQVMTVEEINLLLEQPSLNDSKGIRDRAMLEVLYATGIRVSEIIALQLQDVNFKLECLHCGTGKNERVVPMGQKAVEALELYLKKSRGKLAQDPTQTALFLNCSGGKMTRQGFWKVIKGYRKRAGIETEITPHSFRHSFAAHLAENGADLESIREMMGHADISTTKVYAAFMNTRIRDVYEKAHPRAV